MIECQITEYNQTAAALTELRSRYVRQYDVSTTAGMAEAKAARATVRGYRVALEKTRVEIKAPALERTRLIDAEAKRITAELLAIEEPIDAAIKAEERRIIESVREEMARLRAAEEARQAEERRIADESRRELGAKLAAERQRQEAELHAEREAMEKQWAELEARQREEKAKQRKAEIISAIEVKEALKLMNVLPDEAIDKAYEIGFKAGYEAE